MVEQKCCNAGLGFNSFGMQFLHVWIQEGERNWFNTPEILTAIHDSIGIWQEWFRNPPTSSVNDVAVVYSPWEAVLHSTETKKDGNGMPVSISWMLYTLESSGFGFDLLTPEDFLRSTNKYKTVVFMNLFTPGSKLAEQLKKRVRQNGVSTIWIYAPGFVTERGFSDQAMSNLTGIKLKSKQEYYQQIIKLADGRIMQVQEPNLIKQYIRTYADDAQAEVLGRFADNQAPAIVRKKLSDGSTSIFCATPVFRTDFMAELLRSTGAHQYLEAARQGFKINDQYLLVHQGFGGVYTVYLPFTPKRIIDCYSGKDVSFKGNVLSLITAKSNTWFLKYEK